MSRLARSLACSLVLACSALLLACGSDDDPRVLYDLVSLLPEAELRSEVGEIVMGTASAHPHLVLGFSGDQRFADGAIGVVSEGDHSAIEFFVAQPRSFRLEVDCQPVPTRGLRTSEIRLWLNGHDVGRVRLAAPRRSYRVEIPVAAVAQGVNTLEFRYGRLGPGASLKEGELGVIFHALRFSLVDAAAKALLPYANAESGELRIPFGTQVDYYLLSPPGSVLEVDAIAGAPEREASLQVRLSRPDGEEGAIADWPLSEAPQGVAIPEGLAFVRLSLVARWRGDAQGGEISVSHPRLRREAPAADERTTGRRPNLILYLADTVRRDSLPLYGGASPLTPQLDSLARQGVVFDNAIAQSSWTRPVVASVFTGMNPRRHGVNLTHHPLEEEAVTLAEMLRSAGYRTGLFTENSHVSVIFGMDQGFGRFFELQQGRLEPDQTHAAHGGDTSGHPQQDAVHEQIYDWLETLPADQPFFLFDHHAKPHAPYLPREEFWQRHAPQVGRASRAAYESIEVIEEGKVSKSLLADLRSLYDAGIADADGYFGALLSELKRRGLYRDSLIVYFSDHGEEFWERQELGHGKTLHAETLRVPLVMKYPDEFGAGRRVEDVVSHVDLLPTLLAVAGLPAPPGLDGRDLTPLVSGRAAPERPAFGHLDFGLPQRSDSVVEGRWKLIDVRPRGPVGDSARAGEVLLYDLVADPEETRNLADRHPEVVRRLRVQLEVERSREPAWHVGEADMDPAIVQRLKALGYVQ